MQLLKQKQTDLQHGKQNQKDVKISVITRVPHTEEIQL